MFRSAFLSALTLLSTVSHINAQTPSLQDVLTGNKNLTNFYNLLMEKYPDLLSVLESERAFEQPVTILAPSNDAFDKIPNSSIGEAFKTNDTDAVKEVLLYHVLPGEHTTASFNTTFQFLTTWLTDPSSTNVTDGQRVGIVEQTPEYVFVSGLGTRSTVTKADVEFLGGVLHVIDMPIIPPASYPETAEDFNVTSFLGADYQNLTLAQLMNLTSDITIFAPSNSAMESVATSPMLLSNATLGSIVDYHIVFSPLGPLYSPLLRNGTILPTLLSGANLTITFASNSLYVNSAMIQQSDLLLANGVMHIIDNVLFYEAPFATPNPQFATQVPVLPQGSSASYGLAPYTSAIPNLSATLNPSSTSSSSSSSSTGEGAAATSYDGSAATSTDSGTGAESTKKSDASVTSKLPISSVGGAVVAFAMCVLML